MLEEEEEMEEEKLEALNKVEVCLSIIFSAKECFFQDKYINRDKELEAEKEALLAEEEAIMAGGLAGGDEEEGDEVDEMDEVGLTDKQQECR